MQTGFRVRFAAAILTAVLTAHWCSAQANPPTDLKALNAKYEQALAGIQTAIDKALEDWPQSYVAELKKVEQKLQGSGDLDGMLAVRKERERFEKEKKIPESTVSDSAVLKDLQLKWRKTPEAIELDRSKRIVALAKSYMAALDEAKKQLTKQGKVDPAIEMKNEIERVKTSAPVTAAEFALANAAASVPEPGKDAKPGEVKPEPGVAEKPGTLPADLRAGLVLYYSFDRDDGKKVTDKSGKGNNGIVQGAKWTPKGKKGGAYQFGKEHGYIEVKDSPVFSMKPGEDKTFCLWWKKDGNIQHKVLLSKWSEANSNLGFALLTLSSERQYYLPFQNGHFAKFSAAFSDDAWNHVALAKSGTTWNVYHNGQKARLVFSDGWPLTVDLTVNTPLAIGGNMRDDGFEGLLDEIMVFDRALTDKEVKKLYDSQK